MFLSRTARAFTLAETLLVVVIISMLAITVIAPYSHYSDRAKLRLSSEKIEQAFTEARVSAMAGLTVPGTQRNADAYVELVSGASTVKAYAAESSASFLPSYAASGAAYEIPLESGTVVAGLPAGTVVAKFSAVTGRAETFAPDGTPIAGFTGGLVRLGDAGNEDAFSRPFRFPLSR